MEQNALSTNQWSEALILERIRAARIVITTTRETETELANDETGPVDVSLLYLRDEFPSQLPHVFSTISNSLAKFFVSFLPKDSRIRDVLWAFEPHLLRIWTVIDEPGPDLEKNIYEAERRFLDKMDDSCDFTIVYAFGKPIADLKPVGAISVK